MALINLNKPFVKIPWSKRAVSYYILLILNTFLFTLIFDEPRIKLFEYSQNQMALIITCAALFNLFLFFILMVYKWVFIIVNPVLFYFGAVGAVYADKFHLDTNLYSAPKFLATNIIASSISTDFESSAFITFMFLLGLILGLIRFFFAKDRSVIRKGQIFALIFIISSITYTVLYDNYKNFKIQPYAFFAGTKDYAVSYIVNSFQSKKRIDALSLKKSDDNITGVIILLDKLSSYPFTNNSEAMPVINKENIILFNNVKSEFANNYYTRSAVITGATAEKTMSYKDNTSILSILKNAGYNTLYIGLYNSLLAKDNYHYNIIKYNTENIYEIKTNNSPNLFRSVSFIDDFVKKNNGGFILVNAEGSSPFINMRYKDFIAYDSADSYKDYLLYINAYINELIKILKDKKSFIIVQGLEGENYSNNLSTFNKESIMMVWVSDMLEKEYNTRNTIISHKNDKILDNTIFNTTLGCFNMQGSGIDNGSNLCRK